MLAIAGFRCAPINTPTLSALLPYAAFPLLTVTVYVPACATVACATSSTRPVPPLKANPFLYH